MARTVSDGRSDADRPSRGYRRYWSGAGRSRGPSQCPTGPVCGRSSRRPTPGRRSPASRSSLLSAPRSTRAAWSTSPSLVTSFAVTRMTWVFAALAIAKSSNAYREGAISVVEEGDRSVGPAVDLVEGAGPPPARRRPAWAVLHHRLASGDVLCSIIGSPPATGCAPSSPTRPARPAQCPRRSRRRQPGSTPGPRRPGPWSSCWAGHRCLLNTCTGFGQLSVSIARDNRMTRDIDPSCGPASVQSHGTLVTPSAATRCTRRRPRHVAG